VPLSLSAPHTLLSPLCVTTKLCGGAGSFWFWGKWMLVTVLLFFLLLAGLFISPAILIGHHQEVHEAGTALATDILRKTKLVALG
jgi:hypothetical protein